MSYKLVKLNDRRYAILDTVTRVFYYGKKKNLIKKLSELNKKEDK